ncbi:MAG: hypothetical protein EON48_08650 [Acetobacteraceae bacterium]|nr:MAG: hypothetical protein EON48_08650 [Acetobacteraceae bacterium]
MKIQYQAALALLFISGLAAAQPPRPSFAPPVFQPAANCPLTFSGTLSPQGQVLSILRVAKHKDDPSFLAAGQGRAKQNKSFCAMEIRLEKPLAGAELLSIDMRGQDIKDFDAVLSYGLRIGPQEHKVEYARGRWLDTASGGEIKRFVVRLSPKTQVVRIALSGMARSYDGTANASYDFDSLDFCFVDAGQPEYCGPASLPLPLSPGASAPG